MSHKIKMAGWWYKVLLLTVWVVYFGLYNVVSGQTCKNSGVEATCYCFDSHQDLYLTEDKIKTVKLYGDCWCKIHYGDWWCKIHYLVNPPYVENPDLSCRWRCDAQVCGRFHFLKYRFMYFFFKSVYPD